MNNSTSPPAITVDPNLMERVFTNLIGNSIKFTPDGGTITLTMEDAGDQLRCSVTDNGEGIPPENLTKIFDPFFTTKAEGKGVGLGLAVTYGIIHAHGGDIEVKSKVGEGTTFTASLPLEQAARDSEPPLLDLTRDA